MNTNARPPKPAQSKSIAGNAPVKQKKATASLAPAPLQRKSKDEEKTLQKKAAPVQKTAHTSLNKTGLPDQLKSGIETLSGHSMDDVKVHYNSPKPATLQAHAYAQGTNIHVAAGQEKHLAHEAWHVVQQKQGRVKPTTQFKEKGVLVNDDKGLEHEADVMGSRALQMKPGSETALVQSGVSNPVQQLIQSRIRASGYPLKQSVTNKLNELDAYLQNSLLTVHSALTFVNIRVQKMYGLNPAVTRPINGGAEILVDIAEWFVRTASIGDLAGMIAHEIGVHTLSDDQLSGPEKSAENLDARSGFKVKVGRHKHHVPAWKVRGEKRQKDHIIVARDKGRGNRPRTSGGVVNRRAEEYARTTLRLGDDIEAHAGLTQKERDKRLHDLINSFLFDYARIIVGNDNGFKALIKTHLVAQVYNYYKDVFIRRHSAAHPWLARPAMQPMASGWGLRAYLGVKITRALIEQLRTNRLSNALDTGAGLIGSGVARLARGGARIAAPLVNAVSPYVAPAVNAVSGAATRVGNAVAPYATSAGNAIGTGLRSLDHAYGEVENLAQNALWYSTVGVAKGAASAGKWAWNRINPFG